MKRIIIEQFLILDIKIYYACTFTCTRIWFYVLLFAPFIMHLYCKPTTFPHHFGLFQKVMVISNKTKWKKSNARAFISTCVYNSGLLLMPFDRQLYHHYMHMLPTNCDNKRHSTNIMFTIELSNILVKFILIC